MSSRAHRIAGDPGRAERFRWGGPALPEPRASAEPLASLAMAAPMPAATDMAALEREAFTKGYAQGERAGAEAGASRIDAMVRRLATTLDELQALRRDLVRRSERDVADLAMAIARRIVMRELALDQDLLLTMARVALDRLGDVATASIHLHPDDYAAVAASRGAAAAVTSGVEVLADPAVRRGGCVVQSEFGSVDVGAAAQIDELTHALFDEDARAPESRPIGLCDDAAA